MPKPCPKCGDPVPPRKKYCCDSCKYWFNLIKKDKESHLPPVKKRNANWFYMIVGKHQLRQRGQGRRINGTIKGSMSCAMYIFMPTEVIAEVNPENLRRHFNDNTFPVHYARICDGTQLTLSEYNSKIVL